METELARMKGSISSLLTLAMKMNFGFFTITPATWDRFGGTHEPPKWEDAPSDWLNSSGTSNLNYTVPSHEELKMIYGGGGGFQRTLSAFYKRQYHTHLAMLEKHTLPAPGAGNFEFKEFTGFFSPFDIRGTAFIVYRYSDPHREDDGIRPISLSKHS
jgi:hypothetical protein